MTKILFSTLSSTQEAECFSPVMRQYALSITKNRAVPIWCCLQTTGAILNFILLMMLNPESQRQAQAELDQVVGRDRLPDFSDKESLPYICAIYKEVLRWNPNAPLGIPHVSTEEDEYRGMKIPKGSVIWPNVWYVHSFLFSVCLTISVSIGPWQETKKSTVRIPIFFDPRGSSTRSRSEIQALSCLVSEDGASCCFFLLDNFQSLIRMLHAAFAQADTCSITAYS